jgi:hypothetical protein
VSERRLLLFHDADLAAKWQAALDKAGLPSVCAVYEKPFKDERGFWQPPAEPRVLILLGEVIAERRGR